MDASRGEIRLGVCRSCLLYFMVSVDAAEMYLHEYCNQSGLAHDEVLRWLPVVAGARLSERVGEVGERRLLGIVSGDLYASQRGDPSAFAWVSSFMEIVLGNPIDLLQINGKTRFS